jgi:hypothetical protein
MALPLAFLQAMRSGNICRCSSKPEVQIYHKVQILEWYPLRLARRNDQLAMPCIESDVTTSAYHFLNHTLADLLYARYLTNHANIYMYPQVLELKGQLLPSINLHSNTLLRWRHLECH